MKYGKIRIQDGNLVFVKHMMINNLPCKDIMWAYMRRETPDKGERKQLSTNYLMITTRRKKKYQFDMTQKEAQECIRVLKTLNPDMAVGFPKGTRIALQNLNNTRDLGGLATQDGRHLLPRKLLRSGDLYHMSNGDRNILAEEYRLKTVIDLRTEAERKYRPDTVLAGVEYYHVSVVDEELQDKNTEPDYFRRVVAFEGNVHSYRKHQYENMILDQYSLKQYARFMDILLKNENGAVLWHCDYGKDRTGVVTALLLAVLGVPKKTIKEDFMRSNHYLDQELQYMIRLLESQTVVNKKMLDRMNTFYKVKESYIDTVFRTIERKYGDMDRFLRRALYLTPKAIEELREKYLI